MQNGFLKFLFFSAFSLLFSCHEKNNNNSLAVKEELRSREVVHLTQNQIAERAFELGDTLVTEADALFFSELQIAKDSSCIPVFDSVAADLAKQYKIQVSRYLFDTSRTKFIKSIKEREVIEAYMFSHQNKIPVSPNYQKDGDKDFIYNKALVLNQKQCSNCHSKITNPLAKGDFGDTIGIWSVKYPKRMVVMSFID
jgi:hypothetical protein